MKQLLSLSSGYVRFVVLVVIIVDPRHRVIVIHQSSSSSCVIVRRGERHLFFLVIFVVIRCVVEIFVLLIRVVGMCSCIHLDRVFKAHRCFLSDLYAQLHYLRCNKIADTRRGTDSSNMLASVR